MWVKDKAMGNRDKTTEQRQDHGNQTRQGRNEIM